MTLILGLKLVVVPLLIWGITLAGRRWGPGVAGWLSAFPVVSAPILFFIAVEQGPNFAAHAALATLSAVLAILVFGLAFAWAALRWPWWGSALAGFAAYALAVGALHAWGPGLLAAGLAVGLGLLVAPYGYPPARPFHSPTPSRAAHDIPWRMAAAAALVLGVTHFSAAMGPRLSGLLAMFPVMASVLAMFSLRQAGAAYTVALMRGMVLGYYAFASFCLVLTLSLPRWGIGPAFTLALLCAVTVQGGSRLLLQRRPTRP